MNTRNWNTYATFLYTYDVANNQRSAGGVHHHQVRKTADGWQKRILQANGVYQDPGPVATCSDADGTSAFATATQREGENA